MNKLMHFLTMGVLCLSCLPAEGEEGSLGISATIANTSPRLSSVEDVAAQTVLSRETLSVQVQPLEQVEHLIGTSTIEKRELAGLQGFSILQALLLFSAGFGLLVATRQVGLRRVTPST